MARRSVLNRSFSTSEKVLMLVLAVLLVVACYYFLVVKNVADTIAANEDRLADIEISVNAPVSYTHLSQTAIDAAHDVDYVRKSVR